MQIQREGQRGREMVETMKNTERMARERAVVMFSMSRECCMSSVVQRLLCNLGVNVTVHPLDEPPLCYFAEEIVAALSSTNPMPTVFIGGNLIGSVDNVITCHMKGSLVPLLKDAGALWV